MDPEDKHEAYDPEPRYPFRKVVDTHRVNKVDKKTKAKNGEEKPRDMQPCKVTSLCPGADRRFVHYFAFAAYADLKCYFTKPLFGTTYRTAL